MKVLRLTPADFGEKPIPIHGPHAHSRILAPAEMRSASAPHSASMVYTCFEPGEIESDTSGCTVLPLRIAATVKRSLSDELVQEPMHTWLILIPLSSDTAFTLSGLCGHAARGFNAERSTVYSSLYSASRSGESSTKHSSRPSALRKALVISSDGKIDEVAPSSAPILVIVALSGTESDFTPSPAYSMIAPTPPFTPSILSTSRITSLALTRGESEPVRFILMILGIVI